jgi:proteasome lid subunit RPN8/RPN11
MFINQEQQKTIKKLALGKPNEEICGLLSIDDNEQLNIIPCKNVSLKKQEHFLINGRDYLKATSIGQIIGIYHSHPNGNTFSELDKNNALGHNLISIIYDIKSNTFNEYHPRH